MMGRYKERIASKGLTKRERDVNYTRDYYRRRLPESISYKEVLINGEPSHLVIEKGTKPYYKKFRCYLEDQTIYNGDYVYWADAYWLVINSDADHEIFSDGELYQCNYKLKWQNESGQIITRWCHIQNASAYNTGEDFASAAKLGTNELGLLLPIDEETIKLERDRRFYMDFTKKKLRYKFTRIDAVCDTYALEATYGQKGLLYIIAMEDFEFRENDNDELEICDYFVPEDATEDIPEGTVGISYIDYFSDVIRVGGAPRVYTAAFVGEHGEVIDGVTAQWEVVSDFAIDTVIDGNTISLSCGDKAAIGSKVLLKVLNEGMESSLEISVSGKY